MLLTIASWTGARVIFGVRATGEQRGLRTAEIAMTDGASIRSIVQHMEHQSPPPSGADIGALLRHQLVAESCWKGRRRLRLSPHDPMGERTNVATVVGFRGQRECDGSL